MQINQDLHVYTRSFGEVIKFSLADGSILDKGIDEKPLMGIFDNAYFLLEIGDIDIDNTQPRLNCVEADIKNVKKGDSVEINNSIYDITRNPQPDGTGMAIIVLAKQGKF